MNRPQVLKFFAEHHWVASVGQLRELDIDASAIFRARQRGLVRSPIRGTVVVTGVELSFEGRALLAQLGAGGEAFVSGPSAGVLYGLRGMPTQTIEVTVKEQRRLALPAGHRLVRTSWIDEERDVLTRDDGLRLATPLRMLFGLAAQFNQHRFERAAEDVWHKQLVTPFDAADYLASIRRSGRTGVRRMDVWLEKTAARPKPSQSGLELDFVDMIERVGLPAPKRQYPVTLLSGAVVHLDLAWPGIRFAIEPGHSWWHGGNLGQRLDQSRDRACTAVGWQVVRYGEEAQRDPATAREVRVLYERRAADLGHSPES